MSVNLASSRTNANACVWTCICPKAPAAELRRHAQAALEDLPAALQPEALRRFASSNHMNTAERDLLRLLRDVGLVFPLPVSEFTWAAVTVSHLKLGAWFRYLLNVRNGGQLLGGFGRTDQHVHLCLRAFWLAFQKERPTHAIFELHSERLHKVIPFALHLDEGRGLRKSAVMVVHAQSIFGALTAPRFRARLADEAGDLGYDRLVEIMLESQFHNAKGSTYLSRMLVACLPKADYTKGNAHVFDRLLDTLREECTDLFENGLRLLDDSRYYFACIAVKGDAPALAKAGNFNRNFMNLPNAICFECLAGSSQPPIPFEDCGRNPAYEATVYTVRPWNNPGALAMIPGVPEAPEMIYARDPFHVYKQSIGGSYAASSIVVLAEMGYWDVPNQNGFDLILDRMFKDFSFFVKHEFQGSLVNNVKHFTRTNLHYPRTNSFPYSRLKGGDIMLLTRWLRYAVMKGPLGPNNVRTGSMVDNPLDPWHVAILGEIANAAAGAIKFFFVVHHHGVWLNRTATRDVGEYALQFCQAYSKLAGLCHRRGLYRYSLVPSLHYFHHFYMDAKRKLQNAGVSCTLSPAVSNCEADEDFIGKVSRTSRHVHPSVTGRRTIDRYLVKMHFVYADAGQ